MRPGRGRSNLRTARRRRNCDFTCNGTYVLLGIVGLGVFVSGVFHITSQLNEVQKTVTKLDENNQHLKRENAMHKQTVETCNNQRHEDQQQCGKDKDVLQKQVRAFETEVSHLQKQSSHQEMLLSRCTHELNYEKWQCEIEKDYLRKQLQYWNDSYHQCTDQLHEQEKQHGIAVDYLYMELRKLTGKLKEREWEYKQLEMELQKVQSQSTAHADKLTSDMKRQEDEYTSKLQLKSNEIYKLRADVHRLQKEVDESYGSWSNLALSAGGCALGTGGALLAASYLGPTAAVGAGAATVAKSMYYYMEESILAAV